VLYFARTRYYVFFFRNGCFTGNCKSSRWDRLDVSKDSINSFAQFENYLVTYDIFLVFKKILNYRLPTDVQAEAIPLILGGGDVLMAAETGSGKTGAFCLPILQIVWETLKDLESGKEGRATSQIQQRMQLILTNKNLCYKIYFYRKW